MDNPEYTFQILEVFSKIKTKDIPRELEEYISYVARTGEPVFQWSLVKTLIKEKLLVVLDEFMEGNPNLEIPPCPNVDPFNFETLKSNLLSRLDSFILPPFTIQRICELLSAPRKEYNRLDKYMRAVEKNVLVVSASDLSMKRGVDGDNNDAVINGILYDKVSDSLNNVSNHVLSGDDADNELDVSSKLDETDAVQQIIEESWTDDNHDEFKLNGGPGNSSLGVNFENELQFVTDKSCEEKNLSDVSNKDSDSSFGSNSMLLDSSLQNIIGESSNIAFDSVSKSEDSFELKNDDTYEFKSDSVSESDLSSASEAEVETAAFCDKSEPSSQVDDSHISSTVDTIDPNNSMEKEDEQEDEKSETSAEYMTPEAKSDDTVNECQLDVGVENANYKYSSCIETETDSCVDGNVVSELKESEGNEKELSDAHKIVEDNAVTGSESCELSLVDDGPEISATLEPKIDISDAESMDVDQAATEFSCGDSGLVQNLEENTSRESEVSEAPKGDQTQSTTE